MHCLLVCLLATLAASALGQSPDEATLEFYRENYCLADYCPERVTLTLQGEQVERWTNASAGVDQRLAQLEDTVKNVRDSLSNRVDLEASEIAELKAIIDDLSDQLNQLDAQLAALETQPGLEIDLGAQTDLQARIEDSRGQTSALGQLADRISGHMRDLSDSLLDVVSALNEVEPRIAQLQTKLAVRHSPKFLALFSEEPRVLVRGGECQMLEITIDVLYETYPYYGGVAYVIALVNDEPVYNGVDDCNVPMNPAAVTDYTFGAPSRTFYIDDVTTLASDVTVSYNKCDQSGSSRISLVLPYLTVKCIPK